MQQVVTLPAQRKTYAEKKKDDFKWAKDCVDAVAIRMYQYNSNDNMGAWYSDVQRKLINYRLYNNEVDQSDFERVCNPYNLKAEELIDKIQPYNKIPNKINVLLGEELKRPFNFQVYLVNDSAVNAYTRAKKELQKKYINYTINNEIAKYKKEIAEQLGNPQSQEEADKLMQEVQQEVDKIVSPEMIDKYMSTNWRDAVEIAMDQLLQWYNRKLRIRNLKNDGFKHGLISGEEHGWVGVINGEPVIEICNPIKLFFHKSSEVQYVQDGMYAGYRTRMTPADIIDRFGDDLTDEQKATIDKNTALSNLYGMTDEIISKDINLLDLNKSLEWRMGKGAGQMLTVGSYGPSALNDLDVVHVEWRSQRKFGFLTDFSNLDENGDPILDLVDESFKIPDIATKVKYKDKYGNNKLKYVWVDGNTPFELEWVWLPEVWEGTRIADNIYVNMRPKPYQARSLKEPYKVKLGYHGLVYNAMNATNISLVDRAKPFQYLYFILLKKMEEVIAKDMPPLTMIDMSMIPKTLTNEQWLYYYKQGLGFYNPHQNTEGDPTNISGQKGPAFEVSRSAMQHVNNYIEILAWVDNQISEVMGVSKGREGATGKYETVANNQQNIAQSTNITEILFSAHNTLWEQILTSFIETVQICYQNDPKKIPVILDDLSRTIIELRPDDITDAELGAFITDGYNDAESLQQLRQLSLTFAQNGGTLQEITKLFKATSLAELQREGEAIDKMKQQLAQAEQEREQEHEKAIEQAKIDLQDRLHLYKLEEIDRKGEWDLRAKEVTALGIDEGSNAVDIVAQTELALKQQEFEHSKNLEQRKLANEERSQQFEEIKHAEDIKQRTEDRIQKNKELKSKEKLTEKQIAAQKYIAKNKPKPSKGK